MTYFVLSLLSPCFVFEGCKRVCWWLKTSRDSLKYLLLKPVYAVIVKGIFCPHLVKALRWLPDFDRAAVVSREEEMTLDVKHGAVNVAQVSSQLLGVSALYIIIMDSIEY